MPNYEEIICSTRMTEGSEEMSHIEYRMPPALSLDTVEDLLPKWRNFKQQFQVFLSAAGFEKLSEGRKASILLNAIGQEAQDLYFNVLKKDEDSQKYERVLQLFDEYFAPKQNELINTFNFHTRKQEDGETFDNFYSEIKKLVKNCNYKELEDRMLRDRIVMGVKDQKIQRKLLENHDLTLDKAVSMCRTAELSREHARLIQRDPEASLLVDTIEKNQYNSVQREAKYSNNFNRNDQKVNKTNYNKFFYHCLKCNREHGPRQCPAFGKTCSKCHKMNHFAQGCKNKTLNLIDVNDCNNDLFGEKSNLVQDL